MLDMHITFQRKLLLTQRTWVQTQTRALPNIAIEPNIYIYSKVIRP